MTPRQLTRQFKGVAERERAEIRNGLISAYQSAALFRAKRLPQLDTLLKRLERGATPAKRRMSWQEMLASARQWTAHLARSGEKRTE